MKVRWRPNDLPNSISLTEKPSYENPYVLPDPSVPRVIRYPQISIENIVITTSTSAKQDMKRMHRALKRYGSEMPKTRPRCCFKSLHLTIAAFPHSIVCTGARSLEEAVEGLLSIQIIVMLCKNKCAISSSGGSGSGTAAAEGENDDGIDVLVADENQQQMQTSVVIDDDDDVDDDDQDVDHYASMVDQNHDTNDSSPSKDINWGSLRFRALSEPPEGQKRYDGQDVTRSRIGCIGFVKNVVVQNVVGALRTGTAVDLRLMHKEVLPDVSSYSPLFPGLILKDVPYSRILGTVNKFKPSLTMFSSGSANITGTKTVSEVYQGACLCAAYLWKTAQLMRRYPDILISTMFSNNVSITDFDPVRRYLMDKNKGVFSELPSFRDRRDLVDSADGKDRSLVDVSLVANQLAAFNAILKGLDITGNNDNNNSSAGSSSSDLASPSTSSNSPSPTVRVIEKRSSVSPIPNGKRLSPMPSSSSSAAAAAAAATTKF
jgi:TATA-box binding protein (TBP) (component of TFIID and TFIIIB)